MTKIEHVWDVAVRSAKTALVGYSVFLAAGGLNVVHLSSAAQVKLTALVATGTALLNIGIKVYGAVDQYIKTGATPPAA